jgi:hypothetical protein
MVLVEAVATIISDPTLFRTFSQCMVASAFRLCLAYVVDPVKVRSEISSR